MSRGLLESRTSNINNIQGEASQVLLWQVAETAQEIQGYGTGSRAPPTLHLHSIRPSMSCFSQPTSRAAIVAVEHLAARKERGPEEARFLVGPSGGAAGSPLTAVSMQSHHSYLTLRPRGERIAMGA